MPLTLQDWARHVPSSSSLCSLDSPRSFDAPLVSYLYAFFRISSSMISKICETLSLLSLASVLWSIGVCLWAGIALHMMHRMSRSCCWAFSSQGYRLSFNTAVRMTADKCDCDRVRAAGERKVFDTWAISTQFDPRVVYLYANALQSPIISCSDSLDSCLAPFRTKASLETQILIA